MKDFKKVTSSDKDLVSTNQNMEEWTKQFKETLLAGEYITTSVTFNEINKIPHKLGRKPQGWLVVRSDEPVTLWSAGDNTKSLLVISSSTTTKLTLYVF